MLGHARRNAAGFGAAGFARVRVVEVRADRVVQLVEFFLAGWADADDHGCVRRFRVVRSRRATVAIAMPAGEPAAARPGYARAVSPFCPTLDMTGTGVSGWRRPGLPDTGPAVTLATFPHLGQAPAPPSKEKRQPQKHATSVITGTFFLCAPLPRSGQPVTAADPEPSCTEWARDVVIQQRRLLLSLRRPALADYPRMPCDSACELPEDGHGAVPAVTAAGDDRRRHGYQRGTKRRCRWSR
jgi:hypothetical protein